MSMSHGAISALLIGLPNLTRGFGADGVASYCCVAHPATTIAALKPTAKLSDRILDLPAGADRPWKHAVVMLHESDNRAHLGNVLHGRLYVAGAVHSATR